MKKFINYNNLIIKTFVHCRKITFNMKENLEKNLAKQDLLQ